jgi:hypothetical protein
VDDGLRFDRRSVPDWPTPHHSLWMASWPLPERVSRLAGFPRQCPKPVSTAVLMASQGVFLPRPVITPPDAANVRVRRYEPWFHRGQIVQGVGTRRMRECTSIANTFAGCKIAGNSDLLRGDFRIQFRPLLTCCVSVLPFGPAGPGRALGNDWRGEDRRDSTRLRSVSRARARFVLLRALGSSDVADAG